ncbi:MAG: phosphate-starvation-inducible PsiE family protein [Calothrix sp. C42_A2020_038]|nr:phosphate-starvation-inducible PsiE family protein [Calothrix sp. C42_A2020_038]
MPSNLKKQFHSCFQREQIVRNLELFQDIIVVSLCSSLFCVMVLRLVDLFINLLSPLEVRQVTSDILFILILVELFRLLIDYLQERRISVGAAVEISIVSSLREVILQGVLDIKSEQLLGISLFLVVLGALFVILPWMSKILGSMIPPHLDTKEE